MSETVPNTMPALFVGYTFIWALFVLYLVSLVRRASTIERALKDLERNLD